MGYGLGYAVLLARAGVLPGRVVGHLDLDGAVGKEKGQCDDKAQAKREPVPNGHGDFTRIQSPHVMSMQSCQRERGRERVYENDYPLKCHRQQ